jgi:DNA-binding MarR family transcriptional regulator
MSKPLSPKHQAYYASQVKINEDKVFACLIAFHKQYGYAPTSREIAERTHICKTRVITYLEILAAKGLIDREPAKARAIRIRDQKIHD